MESVKKEAEVGAKRVFAFELKGLDRQVPSILPSAACRPRYPGSLANILESFADDIVFSRMEPENSTRGLFASAKAQRKELDSFPDPTTTLYQENLQAAIASLEECRRLAERISLFSSNEVEDDVASGDLQ